MFSTLPIPAHTYNQPYYYTPVISSPLSSSPLGRSLSPRDPNVPTSLHAFSSEPIMPLTPTPSKLPRLSPDTASSSSSSRESAYSKRITKANPLIHGRSSNTGAGGRETRRKLFLKRVRDDSDDKRWKARGGDDEMMRSIWIAEQRRREDRQRRESMGQDALPVEEEVEFLSLDEIMADEVALMEQAELDALASLNEKTGAQQGRMPPEDIMDSMLCEMSEQGPTMRASRGPQPTEIPFGGDDDEYDDIFMNVIQEENRMASQSSRPADVGQDLMDMS